MMTPRAGTALQMERDEQFELLVELAPDGIVLHDGERVIAANAAAQNLVGASTRDQIVGQPLERFLSPPFLKGVEAQLTGEADAAALAPAMRDRLRRLDGGKVEVEVRSVPCVTEGRPAAHVVIRDITDRLAAEQAARDAATVMQDAQKMEAVGALAGGVAHEVNNMLQIVLGGGALLLEQPDLTAAHRRDLEQMLSAAERAATVTQQLLAFSRRAAHQPVPVDLTSILEGLAPTLRRLLGDSRRLVTSSAETPAVLADPGQLQQVVVNLALNARDATPSGGTISISSGLSAVQRVVRDADGRRIPMGRYGRIVVRDSGHGMNADVRSHIFEPFFTTKPRGEGTGLGLAAVHGILSQSSAYLTLKTAPGAGATFELYLPLAPGDPSRAAAPARTLRSPAPPAGIPTARVLVVDDEPALRAIAARILERSGYRTSSAGDAEEALALLEGGDVPDVLLCDVRMPGMSGVALAREVRRHWPTVRVLLMSGNPADALRGEADPPAAAAVLEKPFTPTALLARVALVLAEIAH